MSTKFFSIIIDECKYVSNFEQLSLCVRYSIGSRSTERFVKFVHLSDGTYTSQDIVNGVEQLVPEIVALGCTLTELGANGASVMSGEWGGVQALLKKTYPLLVYVHCVAHRLNLVVVKSLKETCKEVLILVDKLHSLFSSAKRMILSSKFKGKMKCRSWLCLSDLRYVGLLCFMYRMLCVHDIRKF